MVFVCSRRSGRHFRSLTRLRRLYELFESRIVHGGQFKGRFYERIGERNATKTENWKSPSVLLLIALNKSLHNFD